MRNMSKLGKQLCSLVLILVMIGVMLPVSLLAEEGEEVEEQMEDQVTSGVESDIQAEANSESDTSVQMESEASESNEATQSEESESQVQTNTGSISGTIWLDENEDGVYDSSESPVADYEVSLYLSSNTNETVAKVTTDTSGNYAFRDLEPNDYVVGIPLSQKAGGTEYLVPLIGISGDNKFALDKTTYNAYTNTITIESESEAKDYSGGIRMTAGIQTLSVGIQDGSTSGTAYTPSRTVIGFAGSEWWVIGNSISGVTTTSANYVTLWAKSNDFGTSIFNPASTIKSKYDGSTLQSVMTGLESSLFTSAKGNTQESSYVINRASIDQNAYSYTNATVAVDAGDTFSYGTTSGKFWPLSRGEWGTVYGTGSTANKTVCSYPAGTSSYETYYWLRSPYSTNSNGVWIGWSAGSQASAITYSTSNAVRPAFYLNLSSVLFTSSASSASSKSTATVGNPTLADATSWSGTSSQPIKLTMKDDTNLGVLDLGSTTEVTAPPGGTVSFLYNGAKTGTGKSVSVMICKSDGTILYYGRPVSTVSTNASGTVNFTVPSGLAVGDYTLKVFNEQVNGNYYTDYASTPVSITLRVAAVKVDMTASPTSKVYDSTVDLTVVIGNTFGGISTIEDVEWFRVPVSNATDYSTSFTTGYNAASSTDRGTLSDPGTSETTQTFNNLTVGKNATYWFKGTVIDGTNTYTGVGFITVDNIYTTTPVSVRGEIGNTSPTEYFYGYEVISGTYGIPYDLDTSTTAPKVVTSPSLGFDSVTINAKSQYSTHWTSTMKRGTGLPLTLTLNSTFLTNTECDGGDVTKYTIVYTRNINWQNITAYFVDESGGTLTSTGGLTYETFSAPLDTGGDVTNFLGDGGSYIPATVTNYVVTGYYVGSTTGTFVSCTDFTTFDPQIPVATSGITDVYIVYQAYIINVTVPSSFYWYADATTETSFGSGIYNIKSGNYSIINNSDELNLKVELDSYAYTSSGTGNTFTTVNTLDITLNLTEDLNESLIGLDLLNGASQYGTYTKLLYGTNYMNGTPSSGDKGIWTFGFDGTYTGALPSSGEVADYTATLTFSIDSTTP